MGTGPTTVTNLTPDLDIGEVPSWHVFEIDWNNDLNAADSGAEDLVDLAIGTYVLDMKLSCILGDTGATSTHATVLLETATTVIQPGTGADNMGATGTTEVVEIDNTEAFPLSAADTLQVNMAIVGDAMSVGPKARLAVLLFRPSRPT